MKKIAFLFSVAVALVLSSCGVGVHSVASGMADKCSVCFVATESYEITVNIDETAESQITVAPGRHKVKVSKNGQEIYTKEIFVSASEVKVIEL